MITRLSFMNDSGYLTKMHLSGTKKTEFGFFVSFKQGEKMGTAYKKVMIQSVYKSRNGELRGNFKKGKVKLDNVLIHPECVPDVVEALAKIFEEHFGVDLVGQKMGETLAGEVESADTQKTVAPIPEKKEDSLDERLKRLGRVK